MCLMRCVNSMLNVFLRFSLCCAQFLQGSQQYFSIFHSNDQKVFRICWILQRFLNAISDLRNIKFSHQETQESGKSKSRSENIVFSNVNGALFDPNDQKVLHLYWIMQRFLNANFDLRNIKCSHWKG